MTEASPRDDGAAAPTIADLLVDPSGGPWERTVADLLSVASGPGRFLVPAGSRRAAARSLLAFNRLRPARVRAKRGLLAGLAFAGGLRLVADPYRIEAAGDASVLLDRIGAELGTTDLLFAATQRPGRGFETPVLQLFHGDGRCIGFAKLGWDAVTRQMVDAEAEMLTLVARERPSTFRSPEPLWHGRWENLSVLVTAPMPPSAKRLSRSALPPVEPLREVASLGGPLRDGAVLGSAYWTNARAVAAAARDVGDVDLERACDAIEPRLQDAQVAFGRWHGDWVEWNLARADRTLLVWDWAYSAPDVPFGFDLLQFYFLRHRNLRGAADTEALDRAATDARPGLERLGIDPVRHEAVIALHRIEARLRWVRAALLRRARPARAGDAPSAR